MKKELSPEEIRDLIGAVYQAVAIAREVIIEATDVATGVNAFEPLLDVLSRPDRYTLKESLKMVDRSRDNIWRLMEKVNVNKGS